MIRYSVPPLSQIKRLKNVTDWGQNVPGIAGKSFVDASGKRKFLVAHSVKKARLIEKLSRAISASSAGPVVQRVVARRGAILRQNYFPGKTLDSVRLSMSGLSEIGKILAGIHSSKIPSSIKVPAGKKLIRQIGEKLFDLEHGKILTPIQAIAIARFLSKPPKNPSVVVCHSDINRGNVVVSKEGVKIIDIGGLRVYFRDYDIARTIFGLGLSSKQERVLLSAYKASGGNVADFVKHKDFWMNFMLLGKLWIAQEKHTQEGSAKTARKLANLKRVLLARVGL
jgi:hypothetical protein